MAEDLEYFGAIDAAAEYSARQEDFLVEEENWRAVQAFIAVQSQFRGSLRYEGVQAGLEMAGIHCTSELFMRLRLMEAGAMKALAEQDNNR